MKFIQICFAVISTMGPLAGANSDYSLEYIEAWKKFYPSKALAQGIHSAIFDFEDRSPEAIGEWVDFNKNMLEKLQDVNAPYVKVRPIDARLLSMQARSELYTWTQQKPHQNSLSLYTMLIAGAQDKVWEATFLTQGEKAMLTCQRLESVHKLCNAAMQLLTGGEQAALERGLKRLAASLRFYQEELPERVEHWNTSDDCTDVLDRCKETATAIQALMDHVQNTVLPGAKSFEPILGMDTYAKRLSLYTDIALSPDELADMALQEIKLVRQLMAETSKEYLQKQYPNRPVPEDFEEMVGLALADMEKDAPTSGSDYLTFWQELSEAAIKFVEEKEIATLPEFQTLRILPAPESAGPAARIGWVDSAPPFAPNPVTTLYLPSIPDTLPAQEQKEFWASFNKPFNRMIVIHELFPGHYMQIKISRESPHPVRLLFPYGPYFEGWATLCERCCSTRVGRRIIP